MGVTRAPLRFEVYLVAMDPTRGSEIRKTRPCLIISPDEVNRHLRTVIVAPMTTKRRRYPSRVACVFQGKHGQVALDQIRTVDKQRLTKRLGKFSKKDSGAVMEGLNRMFAP